MAHQCRANDKRTIIVRQRETKLSPQNSACIAMAATRWPRKEKMCLFHRDGSFVCHACYSLSVFPSVPSLTWIWAVLFLRHLSIKPLRPLSAFGREPIGCASADTV